MGTIHKPDTFKAHTSVPFDDIFVPEVSEKTYLQLRHDNQLCDFNYRTQALMQFAQWYTAQSLVKDERISVRLHP